MSFVRYFFLRNVDKKNANYTDLGVVRLYLFYSAVCRDGACKCTVFRYKGNVFDF